MNAASGATGGGQSTNLYAGGIFELGPEDALIVENRFGIEPQYAGFHLANLWGESLDFANHQSSLNGSQAERDEDGVIRYVVAHRDPGVPNWLDTTGHPEGFLTPRWAYTETPPRDRWPGSFRRRPGPSRPRSAPSGSASASDTSSGVTAPSEGPLGEVGPLAWLHLRPLPCRRC